MRSRSRPQLTFANVVSVLALFVALGGSSYAAIKVTGKNVKNSSLTGKDVKNNSLKGADVTGLGTGDIRDSSLLAKDFKPGQLPAGRQGPQGAPGVNGTARGYALVESGGTLTRSQSKNVDRAFKHHTGSYCVNFTFQPLNVVVTRDINSGFGEITAAPAACFDGGGSSYNVQVSTASSAGSADDAKFYVMAN